MAGVSEPESSLCSLLCSLTTYRADAAASGQPYCADNVTHSVTFLKDKQVRLHWHATPVRIDNEYHSQLLTGKTVMTTSRFLPKFTLFLLAILIVAACSAATSTVQLSDLNLPDFVRDAPPAVKEAYQYAALHPDELAKYPCYCGCGQMGHTSNRSCYIKDIAVDGRLTFDEHAAGCGICVDITRDVMRLKSEGQSSKQIRAYIDAQYSAFGPSTNTPLPQD